MTPSRTSLLSTLLAFSTVPAALAQIPITLTGPSFTSSVTVIGAVPTGVQDSQGSLEATLPINCIEGCLVVAGTYGSCYLGINVVPANGTVPQVNQTACDQFLCRQDRYDQLSQCLNCIAAGGGEKPFGFYTNSSLTTLPTPTSSLASGRITIPTNPLGLIDAEQGSGWLRNVSGRCSSLGTSLTGATSVTAVPTTTELHYTTWTTSQAVNVPQWTGLTTFTDLYASYISNVASAQISRAASLSSNASARSAASGASSSPTANGGSGGASNSASSGAAAATTSVRSGAMESTAALGSGLVVVSGVILGLLLVAAQ